MVCSAVGFAASFGALHAGRHSQAVRRGSANPNDAFLAAIRATALAADLPSHPDHHAHGETHAHALPRREEFRAVGGTHPADHGWARIAIERDYEVQVAVAVDAHWRRRTQRAGAGLGKEQAHASTIEPDPPASQPDAIPRIGAPPTPAPPAPLCGPLYLASGNVEGLCGRCRAAGNAGEQGCGDRPFAHGDPHCERRAGCRRWSDRSDRGRGVGGSAGDARGAASLRTPPLARRAREVGG